MTVPIIDANETEGVRLAIYAFFARTGHSAQIHELANTTSLTTEQVKHALQALHASHDIVLSPTGSTNAPIAMARPFSSGPLGFSVMGKNVLWWGGCAWDSFAIPHLIPEESEVLVATRCPACGDPHAWVVNCDAPPAGDQVVHFLTPMHRVWDDVLHSCAHQRIFCSTQCVGNWLACDGSATERGYVMDLKTLWKLASRWYAGRMERGYKRREPEGASTYLWN